MELIQTLAGMLRNMVRLTFSGEANHAIGASRFGGRPDVPADFVWPQFETDTFYDSDVTFRAMSFLAQLNCEELSGLDGEGLLPKTGLLSFFYECGSMRWGFDPKDEGCARVFWFEGIESLHPAAFPDNLPQEFRFPAIGVMAAAEQSWPCMEDVYLGYPWPENARKNYETARAELGDPCGEEEENSSKLLGWPDIIQNNICRDCELVTRGYYLGSPEGYEAIPAEVGAYADRTSRENWRLLFQLDTVQSGDFELMFGDCGRLYFYIRKEDLLARRFDRIWLTLQCG